MTAFECKPSQRSMDAIRTAMPAHLKDLFPTKDDLVRDLAEEIAELRQEISALRAELAPARSVILTGAEVVRELKGLRLDA